MKKKEGRIINENTLLEQKRLQSYNSRLVHEGAMTVSSTLKKSLCALLVTIISAAWVWFKFSINEDNFEDFQGIFVVTGIGVLGLIFALSYNLFKAKYIIFPYAILKGISLGLLSHLVDTIFPGIVFQAVLGTFIVFIVVAYISANDIIKVDHYFRKRLMTALFALIILYFINFILHITGIYNPFHSMIYGNSWLSILFSIFVIGLASCCLLADLDSIKQGAKRNFSKEMEWYCAMSLLVTILWIYLEVLRLLIKLNSRGRKR